MGGVFEKMCCNSRTELEVEINNFMKDLKIRKSNPTDLIEELIAKIDYREDSLTSMNSYLEFINSLLINLNDKEESIECFSGIFKKYKDDKNLKFLCISFLFLCSTKFASIAKSKFKLLIKFFHLEFKENERKETFYQKQFLKEFTKFYVNLVSLDIVKFYKSSRVIDWKSQTTDLESYFSENIQNEYVNRIFKNFNQNSVSLDEYWIIYQELSNDIILREHLIELYESSNSK